MTAPEILAVLDQCAKGFSFPMLDNGYVYLAATRMALFRSEADWAIVIEEFGYNPRAGFPEGVVFTYGSRLTNRKTSQAYVSEEAFQNYLKTHSNNEFNSVQRLECGAWFSDDDEYNERVAPGATEVIVGGLSVAIPTHEDLQRFGITPESSTEIELFELCRFIAETVERDRFFALPEEQRFHVPPELTKILQLEEWNHPDLCNEESPSDSETFQQMAAVLATGNLSLYSPTLPPNTHWSNWPEGGLL